MKITSQQLRKIIAEEVMNLRESSSPFEESIWAAISASGNTIPRNRMANILRNIAEELEAAPPQYKRVST